MSRTTFLKVTGFLIIACLAVGSIHVKKAEAVLGVGDTAVVFDPQVFSESVIIAANTTILSTSNYALNFKEYTLDGIAWGIAKMVLQQMTTDVVNWINSGFQGSPAFLTDPESFFLDQADQLTGAFISDQGPLQALCSPFSVDIRLALSHSQTYQQRYTCTLSSIIKNLPNNTTINGRSLSGFMKGDFSQGGWQGFIALTTEPQNNPTGAYLAAQSDINNQIAIKKNSITVDLNRGNGFMSWKKCTDVPAGTTSAPPGKHYEIKGVSNGHLTFQDCHVETPGSVVAGTLQKQLGIPADQLNIADEFNEIVGALLSQLVTQVLQAGLHAASQPSSGGTTSFTNQLSKDSSATISNGVGNLQTNVSDYIEPATDLAAYYSSAYSSLQSAQQRYVTIRTNCLNNGNQTTADTILQKLTSTINPAVLQAKANYDAANAKYTALTNIQNSLSTVTTAAQLQDISKQLADMVNSRSSNSAMVTPQQVSNAANAADAADATAQTWLTDASTYAVQCPASNSTATTTTP